MPKLRTQDEILASWGGKTDTVVSVSCITYNHEPFIRDAIEGFLIQKTDFPFEVLIHDDASTDKTADIIREYEALYPAIIKPIYQSENQYSKGIKISSTYNIPRAQGVYIARCEGDDFWICCRKLQLQKVFLDLNPDFVICGHAVRQVDAQNNVISTSKFNIFEDRFYSSFDMAFGSVGFPMLSVMYRNLHVPTCQKAVNGDTILFTSLSNYGAGFIFKDIMGVHRFHLGGIWSGRTLAERNRVASRTRQYLPDLVSKQRRSIVYLANAIRDARHGGDTKSVAVYFFGFVSNLNPRVVAYLFSRLVKLAIGVPHLQPRASMVLLPPRNRCETERTALAKNRTDSKIRTGGH